VIGAATDTPEPTAEPREVVPTATETATKTATATLEASTSTPPATDTPTPSDTATAAPTVTPTATGTATPEPPTATSSATSEPATETHTQLPPTATNTSTQTPTNTHTATATSTNTATKTPTATATSTASASATASRTLAPPTATRTATTPPISQTLTLAPVADAYVDAAAPTTKYGTSTILRTQSLPGQRAFLRFNVAGVAGRPVVRATLRIFVNQSTTVGFRVHGVSNNSWVENTVTHKNAPAVGSLIASSGAHAGSAWVLVDVTSYITGDGTFSLAMTTTNTASVTYASRNATTNRPQLILTLGP
jgi:hypothetical protein